MKNLCNFACETKIDGKNYKLEFDNRAYGTVENLLDKGTFKIFQCFVLDNNTKLQDCLEIFCAGLIKNHSSEEIEAVRKALDENPAILHKNLHALQFAYANVVGMVLVYVALALTVISLVDYIAKNYKVFLEGSSK